MKIQSLNLTASYKLDDDSSILFHGPDTSEWLQFFLIVGRSEAIAISAKDSFDDEVAAEAAAIESRRKSYIESLTVSFHSAINVELDGKPVTKKNAADFFRALDSKQRIDIIQWLQERESFTKKQ